MVHRLDFLSSQFADRMYSSPCDPIELLEDTVVSADPPTLVVSDFGHIDAALRITVAYLRHAVAAKRPGVNILLYGVPGTGKTQLARVLATEACAALLEISDGYRDGTALDGGDRLKSLRAAQHILQGRPIVLAFDELEDAFAAGFGERSAGQSQKAWVNRILEGNPLPTIWLSNSRSCLDPAFVRRFDIALELPIPPKPQRERILHAACRGMLDDERVGRLATHERLAPAIVTRAAAVVEAIGAELGETDAGAALELLVAGTLSAQGHRSIAEENAQKQAVEGIYDLRLVNADVDLHDLAERLARVGSARILCFGAPGTGKTAYARWLAKQIDRPLLVRRASDLLAPNVGENEQNIAAAFREAQRAGAALLIDEVDTFLQDRRGATRHWEISLVNELLTQAELFEGVFLATTNSIDGIDRAALRRFDAKIRFAPLNPTQAWELLRVHCLSLGLGEPGPALMPQIARLDALVPGDYAVVARQARLRELARAEDFASALRAEVDLREGVRRRVGFEIG